jgi:hypothetical protein
MCRPLLLDQLIKRSDRNLFDGIDTSFIVPLKAARRGLGVRGFVRSYYRNRLYQHIRS